MFTKIFRDHIFFKFLPPQVSLESISLSLKYFIVAKSIGNVMQFWQKKCIGVSSPSKSVYFAAGCNQIDFFSEAIRQGI